MIERDDAQGVREKNSRRLVESGRNRTEWKARSSMAGRTRMVWRRTEDQAACALGRTERANCRVRRRVRSYFTVTDGGVPFRDRHFDRFVFFLSLRRTVDGTSDPPLALS